MSCNTSFPASLLIPLICDALFFISCIYFTMFRTFLFFFGNLIHFTDNHAVFLCFTIILFLVITLPDRASDPAWSMASPNLSGGIMPYSIESRINMRLFSQHCWMMCAGWCHKVHHPLSCSIHSDCVNMIHVQRFGHRTCDPNATNCAS